MSVLPCTSLVRTRDLPSLCLCFLICTDLVGLLCGWFLGFFLLNELSSLKLHPFVISKFYKQAWDSRLRVSQGRNQGIGWLCSYVDALEKYLLPNAFGVLSEWSSLEL